jgi:hypothetical protein
MKKVSDILYVPAPLSFIQIKKNMYEGVCPWCCKDLGKVKATTYGDLVNKLYPVTADHMDVCVNREAHEIKVTI